MKAMMAALITTCVLASVPLMVKAAEPKKIAFVDTGNTGRSVTAEALANAAIQDRKLHVAVISRAVDVDPFDTIPEANAAALLKQRGLDVSAHRAAQLAAADVKHADLILVMTAKHRAAVLALYPEAKDKTFLLSEYATGTPEEVVDAYGKDMPVYEHMVEQISDYIPAVLTKAAQ